eukprot:m.116816 g.116816  ORF g.116816 m.116816 type:complete len:811 (-) comp12863_c0_seq2:104-2536(-)
MMESTEEERGMTPLHLAVDSENAKECEEILKMHPHFLEATDSFRRTPLHLASLKGNDEIVEMLVQAGANVHAHDKWKSTPLHYAANGGFVKVIDLLGHPNEDINTKNWFLKTPLHWAAASGHFDAVVLLCKFGANHSIVDENHETPLHVAARNNHVKVVEFLKELGLEEEKGEATPLHIAAESGKLDVVKTLVDGGAKIFATNKFHDTPLHLATKQGHTPVVEFILSVQPDTFHQDLDGMTAMHFAARNGHLEALQVLCKYGASVNDIDKDNWTPIHYATDNGHFDVVAFLAEKGAVCTAVTDGGNSPLHYACFWGRLGIAQLLVALGCEIHRPNLAGETPRDKLIEDMEVEDLEYADATGRIKIEEFFLKFEKQQTTKLHLAAKFNLLFLVKRLLEEAEDKRKEQLCYLDSRGDTCFHVACKNGSAEVVEFLLKQGANKNTRNSHGQTPCDIAKDQGHDCVINVLEGKEVKLDSKQQRVSSIPNSPLKFTPRAISVTTSRHQKRKGSRRGGTSSSGQTSKFNREQMERNRIKYFAERANLSRAEANRLVLAGGEGTFLLRKSSSLVGAIVLVACFNGEPCSFQFPFKDGRFQSSFNLSFPTVMSLVHACKTKKLLPGTLTHCVRSRDGDVLATMTAQEERAYLQPVIQSTSTYEIPLQQDDENAIYAEVQDPALDEEQQHPSQIYDNVEYEDASDSILKQREPLPKIPTSVTSSTSPLQTSNIHRSESVSSHFNTPMNEWDDHQLAMWLDTRNMSFAKRVFLENGVDGSVFLTLEQDDLSDLGMSKIRCKSLLVKRDKFIQEQEKAMKL